MKEIEPLRKKAVRILASPAMAITVGFSIAVGGVAEGSMHIDNNNEKAEQAFPHVASTEELKKATTETLVFDKTVHDLVVAGQSNINIAKIANQPNLAKAITLVDGEQIRNRQRDEFRRNMDSRIWKFNMPLAIGGVLLLVGGSGWESIRSRRKQMGRKNQVSSPAPSNA